MKQIFIGLIFSLASVVAHADMMEQSIGPAVLVQRFYKLDIAKLTAALTKGEGGTIWSSNVVEYTGSEVVLQKQDGESIETESGGVKVSYYTLANGYYVIIESDGKAVITDDDARAALQDSFQKSNLATKTLSIKVLKVSSKK